MTVTDGHHGTAYTTSSAPDQTPDSTLDLSSRRIQHIEKGRPSSVGLLLRLALLL